MSKLKLSGVSKAYAATLAVRRGDLELRREVHVLMVQRLGKKHPLQDHCGQRAPDGGRILVDDQPVTISGPRSARATASASFYQELSLAAHRSVEEKHLAWQAAGQIAGSSSTAGNSGSARPAISAFSKASAAKGFRRHTRRQPAPDQRQLVEINEALAAQAPLPHLSTSRPRRSTEPSGALLRNPARSQRRGRGIHLHSHRMDEIKAIGDRVHHSRRRDHHHAQPGRHGPATLIRLMVGGAGDMPATQAPSAGGGGGEEGPR